MVTMRFQVVAMVFQIIASVLLVGCNGISDSCLWWLDEIVVFQVIARVLLPTSPTLIITQVKMIDNGLQHDGQFPCKLAISACIEK